ncbi:MAG: 3-hydroxybutyrate oligomer hydrolase family protein [Steroidobacteraceae bacterium]
MTIQQAFFPVAALGVALLAGCAASPRTPPSLFHAERIGEPIRYELDGVGDDLLTAGLGTAGLLGAAPVFADPRHPTARELRRRAIYMNYRGLADLGAAPGGGPAVPGIELLVGLHSKAGPSTALLQIPRGFDAGKPCLIAVASSGSRGIYGALPTAGGWGLRRGCAVVHTDKGTGSGIFDVASGRGLRIDGTVGSADDPLLSFLPDATAVAKLKVQRPDAVLFRHANSGLDVEAHWGEYLLQAIDVAFELLNREFPGRAAPIAPANTLVIAAGISNGGGTVLHAMELDRAGWIDGAVASEPNITVPGFRLFGYEARPLYDLAVAQFLLQPCAVLADEDRTAPFLAATTAARPALEQWCRDLAARGEIAAGANDAGSTDIGALARAARDRILALGILPQALRLGHVNVHASLWSAVAVSYAAALAGMTPDALPCGVSFAATDAAGAPRALTDEELARLFADSTGIAPTAGINLVAPRAGGAPAAANFGSIDLALCLRGLHDAVAPGLAAVAAHPRADARPLVVMHGRGDGLIPVNHTSRPYYAASVAAGGADAGIRYYEVERGQHFDAFLPLPGFAGYYVAMQPFFEAATDLMAARLGGDLKSLPPSQVVRKEILASPGTDAITIENGAMTIPP